MLVLTRRPGEAIVIGNGIKLTVVGVGPGRVKIGIEAPPSVRVDREEVHTRIQQEQATDVLVAVSEEAAGTRPDVITTVVSGSETGVLPSPAGQQPPDANPPAKPTRPNRYNPPRKPR
jgi:carbon storage regulator